MYGKGRPIPGQGGIVRRFSNGAIGTTDALCSRDPYLLEASGSSLVRDWQTFCEFPPECIPPFFGGQCCTVYRICVDYQYEQRLLNGSWEVRVVRCAGGSSHYGIVRGYRVVNQTVNGITSGVVFFDFGYENVTQGNCRRRDNVNITSFPISGGNFRNGKILRVYFQRLDGLPDNCGDPPCVLNTPRPFIPKGLYTNGEFGAALAGTLFELAIGRIGGGILSRGLSPLLRLRPAPLPRRPSQPPVRPPAPLPRIPSPGSPRPRRPFRPSAPPQKPQPQRRNPRPARPQKPQPQRRPNPAPAPAPRPAPRPKPNQPPVKKPRPRIPLPPPKPFVPRKPAPPSRTPRIPDRAPIPTPRPAPRPVPRPAPFVTPKPVPSPVPATPRIPLPRPLPQPLPLPLPQPLPLTFPVPSPLVFPSPLQVPQRFPIPGVSPNVSPNYSPNPIPERSPQTNPRNPVSGDSSSPSRNRPPDPSVVNDPVISRVPNIPAPPIPPVVPPVDPIPNMPTPVPLPETCRCTPRIQIVRVEVPVMIPGPPGRDGRDGKDGKNGEDAKVEFIDHQINIADCGDGAIAPQPITIKVLKGDDNSSNAQTYEALFAELFKLRSQGQIKCPSNNQDQELPWEFYGTSTSENPVWISPPLPPYVVSVRLRLLGDIPSSIRYFVLADEQTEMAVGNISFVSSGGYQHAPYTLISTRFTHMARPNYLNYLPSVRVRLSLKPGLQWYLSDSGERLPS